MMVMATLASPCIRNYHDFGHPQPPFGARHLDTSRQPIQGIVNNKGLLMLVMVISSVHQSTNFKFLTKLHYSDANGDYSAVPSYASNQNPNGYNMQSQLGVRRCDLHRQCGDTSYGNFCDDVNASYDAEPDCVFGNQPPFGARHRDLRYQAKYEQKNTSPSYDNVSTNENYADEPSSTANEPNKMVVKIKKCYERLLPLIYSMSIDQFNKNDWLKLTFEDTNL
ncbi:hypothetical protein Bhyg_07834 [Pseudolycoriella hygida]|uniref:Uncharacterized protein n=1 Tax=Pseudolycoriella hygida TaxID=35572 RepID=A0A9Q0N3F4_9DIPT|nr:hypothetical protein Bhyg_07834 [Pseudolycoriella hygida]